MAAPTITILPDAPSISQPATFQVDAATFVAALPTLQAEINAFGAWLNTNSTIIGSELNAMLIGLQDGSAAAPSLYFSDDSGTGFYRPGSGILAWTSGGSERGRIDATGILMVGKAATGSAADGVELNPGGLVSVTRENDPALLLNRRNGDGQLAQFRKDNVEVGWIGVTAAGAFINLGGTAAANKLDDYEEGTFTPALTGSFTYTTQEGSYIKIGNLVHVQITIGWSANSSGSVLAQIGLPFNVGSQAGSGSVGYSTNIDVTGNYRQMIAHASPSNNNLAFYLIGDNSAVQSADASLWSSSGDIRVSITYIAA